MLSLALPTEYALLVSGPPQGQWHYPDWERLPDDGNRYEIIDGVLYMTTAPSNFHQWIIQGLHEFIGIPMRRQGLGYAFFAPIGVLMPGCDPVQPDYVVVTQARAAIIRDRRIMGVPDLIIEVLSPGNAEYDRTIKLHAYAAAGVPEYAMIDPQTRCLYHYRLLQPDTYGESHVANEGDSVSFDCVPSLVVPLSELFAGAPDTTL
ncbi:MAG: Uma2 family endonuclease [Chloroflexaceae bacterium]|jgi:Uma2 family endonuclease|nr:Uma2 family endonuclease [Chloroflexaceae bacterium]